MNLKGNRTSCTGLEMFQDSPKKLSHWFLPPEEASQGAKRLQDDAESLAAFDRLLLGAGGRLLPETLNMILSLADE